LQALHRRRLAKKELVVLKTEAKSATKFKEISYKLENKVVELTQTLQKRTAERKEFQERVSALESQIQQFTAKQSEAEARIKDLTAELKKPTVPAAQFEELVAAKQEVDRRVDEALAHISQQDAEIDRLNADLVAQHKLAQEQQVALEAAASRNVESLSAASGMQDEITALKEQINRANALSALTRNTRVPQPPSPTVTHLNGSSVVYRGMDSLPNLPSTGRTPRRHSMTGVLHDGSSHRTSADERILESKKDAAQSRAISMAFPRDGPPNGRDSQGLPVSFENPGQEIMRMLEDEAALERDVLQGLIMDLKILTPSLNNPPKFNEVMFPANLVSLIVNEMWKYGLIKESERFLANVMQHIQKFVMVSSAGPYR
jgi:myosin-5